MEKEKILLAKISDHLSYEKEIRKLKGEDFNIFMITNKTSSEEFTHSAFIAELLNPRGSHHLGDVFLRAFIDVLKSSFQEILCSKNNTNPFNSDELLMNTIVDKEKYIGAINDKAEEGMAKGGKIDILLELNSHNIVIENKIYAGFQPKQMERYVNYNKGKSIVLLLTLFGDKPNQSCVIEGQDYYSITYRDEIDDWLAICHSLAVSQPVLRESIKQYHLLIKRLTGKMEKSKKIENVILGNLEAAKGLVNNYEGALNTIKERFREDLLNKLKDALNNSFALTKLESIHHKHPKILIKPVSSKNNNKIYFTIESLNGIGHGHRGGKIHGTIFIEGGDKKIAAKFNEKYRSEWTPIEVPLFEDSFANSATIIKLHTDENYKSKTINTITEKMMKFIEKHEKDVVSTY